MLNYPFRFPKLQAFFVKRLNRFVLEVLINNKISKAYLPNPGRLWEILLPGRKLYLIPNKNCDIPYTVLACEKNRNFVLLHTHFTNQIVFYLMKYKKIPFWKEFHPEKIEKKFFNSRFDLYLKSKTEKMILEVKTCTLFGQKIAMFPDAQTKRGSKHLVELAELSKKGYKTAVLFVVMNPQIKYFLPAYHIDYEFFKTFLNVANNVEFKAVSLKWDETLTEVKEIKEIKIPFNFLKSIKDIGAYLLILKAEKDSEIEVGSLEKIHFKKGYYVYVGSALNNLSKRIKRHLRKRKKKRWHIDYITEHFSIIQTIPIRTQEKLECEIAQSLKNIADEIENFGSSDCKCGSHLFYFEKNPLLLEKFQNLIINFRINQIEKCLENY
jgi:sugar fermentation stimulation protein A